MRLGRRQLVQTGLTTAVLITPAGRLLAQTPVSEADALTSIKASLAGPIDALVTGSQAFDAWAKAYYELASGYDFDYQGLWDVEADTLTATIEEGRRIWVEDAHNHYELAEGLVAGVPALAQFDIWLDAGPSAAEDIANAYDWTLELPNGTSLEQPGNIFHSILEPALWGTNENYTGLAVDIDGDGQITLGESLPDANIVFAGADALLDAASQLNAAVVAWQPTLSDTFTALVVMIPTGQDYFEQWRNSPFVNTGTITQEAFVGSSRLVDVLGIYKGLQTTWHQLALLVAEQDPALAEQISTDLDALVTLVQGLLDQENADTRFTAEEAETYGEEVQARAEAVAGAITQAAALLGVDLQ